MNINVMSATLSGELIHQINMTLQELEQLLQKPAKQIFGDKPEDVLRELRKIAHPDLGGTPELFNLLTSKYDSLANPFILKSKVATYELESEPIYDDSLSSYYISGKNIIQISKHPKVNIYLDKSYNLIKKINKESEHWSKYVPLIKDQFTIVDNANVELSCLVHERTNPNLFSLISILEKHKHLNFRHMIWMVNRICEFVGYLHEQQIVHGAIYPEHLHYNINNHGLVLSGLEYHTKVGEKPAIIISTHKNGNYNPPEINNKDVLSTSTDVYMIAKIAMSILDPSDAYYSRYKQFFSTCFYSQKSRIQSAYELLDELKEFNKYLGIKKQFVTFEM